MRIVFMGTPECAVPVLDTIHKTFKVQGVFSQPDKPKGRGMQMTSSPVKSYALENSIPCYTPISFKKDLSYLEILKNNLIPDLIITVAYGQILPPALLAIPQLGSINLHFSLLPKYRGAAPVSWALLNGESETGVTIFFLNEKMDEGDIIIQKSITIEHNDNRKILENRLADLGAELLKETIYNIKDNKVIRIPQNHQYATYAPKLKTADGRIDWSQSAEKIFNQIRGLNPDPGAYTFFNNRRIKIWEADFLSVSSIMDAPGTITAINKVENMGIEIATKKGILVIRALQPEGKKVMNALAFCNGYQVKIGQIFRTEDNG